MYIMNMGNIDVYSLQHQRNSRNVGTQGNVALVHVFHIQIRYSLKQVEIQISLL